MGMSTDLDINYELNLFSQPSQSPSARSTHSSPSQHNQCTNCGAQNTLTDDHISGGKICTNCSHIVQGYQNMASAEMYASEDEEEIAEQAHKIRKATKQQKLRPLNKEIIRSQHQYSKIILNAFQCLLQCQVSALIIEYNVKPHLYHIVGQIWFRFINQIWIKQGFGNKSDDKSDWIWNKNQNKLYQNNDFIEKWITPKRSVLDVLLTTEDELNTSSDDNSHSPTKQSIQKSPNPMLDAIDLDSLYSDTSNHSQLQNESISRGKS